MKIKHVWRIDSIGTFLLQKALIYSQSKNSRKFIKLEVSLPYFQKSITEPYSGPDEYSACRVLPRNLVISGLPTKILYVFLFSLMQATRSYKTYKCILC
jgi:hypothetical protein